MVGAGAGAGGGIDGQPHAVAGLQRAGLDVDRVDEEVARLLAHGDERAGAAGPLDLAAVGSLAAALGVEGGGVEQHLGGLAGLRRVHLDRVAHQSDDLAHRLGGLVADEGGRAEAVAQLKPLGGLGAVAGARPGLPRLRLLAGHGGVEAFQVHGQALGAHRVLRQVEGEAVGVVELEGRLAGEHAALGQPRGRLVEQAHAAAERGAEPLLLLAQGVDDGGLGADQLGIGGAHLRGQRGREAVHQGVGGAQQVRVAHGAAHDPAQHVAATLVRRRHPVGDQERGRAQVVGQHPVAGGRVALGGHAGEVDGAGDQGAEQVDVVVGGDALQHGRDPLQPHAGVDGGLGQGFARAVAAELLVLHEDEVPDLDPAVAVLVQRCRGGRRGWPRRGRRRSPSTGRRGRCRPWTRSCRRSGCG